ncbi:MAG: STAS/SEC14 domain-containing protein [Pseudomonadota bacterium]
MLRTQSVTQIATSRDDLLAFRINGEVSKDDMTAMAQYMNDVFDTEDRKVDMMLIFDRYDGAAAGASFSREAIKSRVKAVWNVNRYIVVGAPDKAEAMVETMGKVIPVKAETYDEEAAAWRAVGATAKAA